MAEKEPTAGQPYFAGDTTRGRKRASAWWMRMHTGWRRCVLTGCRTAYRCWASGLAARCTSSLAEPPAKPGTSRATRTASSRRADNADDCFEDAAATAVSHSKNDACTALGMPGGGSNSNGPASVATSLEGEGPRGFIETCTPRWKNSRPVLPCLADRGW
jgi:hypothetical protein